MTESEVPEQETPASSPAPPPAVNVGVGGPNWSGTAIPPTERKSIAEDPTGEGNTGSGADV